MSTEKLEDIISQIRTKMGKVIVYQQYSAGEGQVINNNFLQDISLLQLHYGKFIGKIKAVYKGDQEVQNNNAYISKCFEGLLETSDAETCFKLTNLAIGKISQLVEYIQTTESQPKDIVSKTLLDQAISEKEQIEKTAIFLTKHGNMPEINRLIEIGCKIGLPIDNHWVLALCSINLIEATVNLKLEKMGIKAEGSFKEKYRKLCDLIKTQEKREIFQLLPTALYDGVRNKLNHASNSNRVTESEAKEINKFVLNFIAQVFP